MAEIARAPPMVGSVVPGLGGGESNGCQRAAHARSCGSLAYVRFSNRPFGVKRFQTIHHCSVDVAHGLVLLFGIGTRALPSWDSKTRWNNLYRGLAVRRTAGPSGHTNSPHPSSREGHPSTAGWISIFLLSHLILCAPHAAAVSLVQRNSVPSTQMRCMITANRRAKRHDRLFHPAAPGDLHGPGLEP